MYKFPDRQYKEDVLNEPITKGNIIRKKLLLKNKEKKQQKQNSTIDNIQQNSSQYF